MQVRFDRQVCWRVSISETAAHVLQTEGPFAGSGRPQCASVGAAKDAATDWQTKWLVAEQAGLVPGFSLLILLLLAWLLLKRQNILLLGKGGQSSALQSTTQYGLVEVTGSDPPCTCCLWQGHESEQNLTGCSAMCCYGSQAAAQLTSGKRAAKCLRLLCAKPAVIKLKVPLGTRACSNTPPGSVLLLTQAPAPVAAHYPVQTFCCRCGSMSTSECRPSWAIRPCSTYQ